MPAKSKAQQRFFGMIHAVQKGDMKAPSEEISKAAKDIKPDEVKKFAETKTEDLPEKVKKESVIKQFLKHCRTFGADPSYINKV